ncbi:MAG: choice-of-anchor tandem repeat GloVer-containing protein [Candidatus Cybelea sp.]
MVSRSKLSEFSRYAFGVSTAAALLAGCRGSQPSIGAPGAMPESQTVARTQVAVHSIRAASSSYRSLYSFMGSPDGAYPAARLRDVKGTLYGTTLGGGAHHGTVFSTTTGGAEKVIYGFNDAPDGDEPMTGLIDAGGTLYGTTSAGGAHYRGTVFSTTTGGAERVLHSFGGRLVDGKRDGEYPGSLIDVGGTLYGTTSLGGVHKRRHAGDIVFSLTIDGTEKVLHTFDRGTDGAGPNGLIDVKGTFYGITYGGGAYNRGTVFSITTSGAEKVLYRFSGAPDGAHPVGGLLDVGGTLYGMTIGGGANSGSGCYYDGCGTVYSVSLSGNEEVLHSFSGPDGSYPVGSLLDVKGTLYGTTSYGGANRNGTVFSVTPGGTEQVLHNFGRGFDGANPQAGVIDVKGTLYGTTFGGGTYGDGTVFALSP